MTDAGEYCRQVEAYLTRVNGGHLVRIAGPGFDLVRGWADEGIPLSVVFRGIDAKHERHRAGRTRRPLRIEFCDADVRETFDAWRRAVGLSADRPVEESASTSDTATGSGSDETAVRRPSVSKHLDRVIDWLSRFTGRLDLSDAFRETVGGALVELSALREVARTARGPARQALAERLAVVDRQVVAAARAASAAAVTETLAREAERELEPFRGRLDADAWRRAVEATVDRKLRERLGLPVVEIAE